MPNQDTSNPFSVVDAFVEKVNSESREAQRIDDVPEFLRQNSIDDPELLDGWTDWRILASDNLARIESLQRQTSGRFPPSFRYFLTNYSFPAFEFGPLMFFANTGHQTFWELEKRLFQDKHMSPFLLNAGFLQIGNPFFYNYDPICFDCSGGNLDHRLVQLDHEAILVSSKIAVAKEVAPSFVQLLRAVPG